MAGVSGCYFTPERQLDDLIAMVEDITDQKQSESALRESENRFRTLFDVAAAGMALFSVNDGSALRVNARFAEFLGYDRDEMLGTSFVNFTAPEELAESTARLEELVTGKSPSYHVERRYLRKDGSIAWGQSSVSLIHNAAGEPTEIVLVVEDITQRKLGEQELRESETRLRVLAESLPQLVWTCRSNGECDYLSAQWVQYTGIPEELQLGLQWLDVVMHPDDCARTYEAWMAAVRDEAPYDLEYRLRRYDGQYRWFKTRGTPFRDSHGEIVRWFGTCTDIHDQRKAEDDRSLLLLREQRARAVAEVLNGVGPMLLTELDSQRLIQKVTDMATQLVGAQLGGFFHTVVDAHGERNILSTLSGSARDAFPGFPTQGTTDVFAPAFARSGVLLSSDITQDPRYGKNSAQTGMPEGHLPMRSYLAVPVVARTGEIMGGLFFGHAEPGMFEEQHAQLVQGVAAQAAIALDNARLFAEVQRSEEALRTSNVELRQANTDLEQFAYAAAHDLQEPLRMVTSYTQLLDRSLADKLDERTRTFMHFVVGGATRMSLLLQDLLAYTETSRAIDSDERVCLNRTLQQVVRNLQPAIEEANAEIKEGNLPYVDGRESQFVQLFQNLISNAIKYRNKIVRPCVEISSEQQGNHWLIRVRDNGMGIDPAYHKQVFGVFKRLHGSEIPGTGIGLAICQRVVERAGGEIWVESEIGQGATFAFTLPMSQTTAAPARH